ncbi:MAG: BrnT family toxin [Bdellovibrionaceae bacterium]|nr:BrnT family toxin [Pseudobdellovibrionaceae bacterium]
MEFEWDDHKAEINLKKHGIRFSEAATVWLDSSALEMADPNHSSHDEERWVRLGLSQNVRALVVVYVEKIEGERIRIISARKAKPREIEQYNSR